MAGIKGVAADTGEVFGGGIILEDAAARRGAVEEEGGGAIDGGKEAGVGAGLDPAEVLDAGFGQGIGLKPKDGRSGAEI